MNPKITGNLLLGLLFVAGFNASTIASSGMHPEAQIHFVKTQIELKMEPYYQAYVQLLAYADIALTQKRHALTDFAVPGFYVDPDGHRNNSKSLQSDSFCLDIPNIDETQADLLTRIDNSISSEYSIN